jgi:hypothetical protein
MEHTFRGKALILSTYVLVLISIGPLIWLIIRTDPDWLLVSLVVAGGLAVPLAWPRKIVVDNQTISQRGRLGTLNRLPLVDVDSLAGSVREGCVIVSGAAAEIRHTWLHADRDGFVRVVEQLTGKKIFWGDWPG